MIRFKAARWLASLALMAESFTSCSAEHSELARIPSPDHRTVAISTVEYGGGAAGFMEHYVYLVEAGSTKALNKPIFTATHCDPTISWSNNHTLQINYQSVCTIRYFENKWYAPAAIQNASGASVEIILNRIAE